MSSFDTFISTYTDKPIDFDGAFGNQCVDLYRQYCKEVLNVPQSKSVDGAYAIWTTYLPDYFTAIPNTPDGVPQKGDIVIWKKGVKLPLGHVAIFIEGNAKKFVSFDQNWPTGSVCHRQDHDYMLVQGWLRPLPQGGGQTMDTIAVNKADFENLVSKSTKYDALVAVGISVPSDVETLKRNVLEANQAAKTAQDEAKNTRDQFTSFAQQIAQRLNSPQDLPRILSAIDESLKSMDAANTNSKKDADDKAVLQSQITDFQAEITRLKLLLAQKNPLDNSTTQELLLELLRRLTAILRR